MRSFIMIVGAEMALFGAIAGFFDPVGFIDIPLGMILVVVAKIE